MATQDKLDLLKTFKNEYVAPRKPVIVDVSPARYISIFGTGEPGGDAFQEAMGGLYAAAYTLKFDSKAGGRDYTVCKLEAQWWNDGDKPFEEASPDEIHYKFMIRTPDFVKKTALSRAQKTLAEKGRTPRAADVILETIKEGTCVQMLHVGPYQEERRTIDVMLQFAHSEGYTDFGTHHEIYLSDPRRVEPARLRTILRYPVTR